MSVSNAWNETIADVNKTLANMNSAISEANGAAENAREEAQEAGNRANAAEEAADAASNAAAEANAEAEKWRRVTVSAVTLEAGKAATAEVTEKDGAKHIIFGVPRGADGRAGDKGDSGRSGVTFTRSGTTLYITTEV